MCYALSEHAFLGSSALSPPLNPLRKRRTGQIFQLLQRGIQNEGATTVDSVAIGALALKMERLLYRSGNTIVGEDEEAAWPPEVLDMKLRQLVLRILQAKSAASFAPNNYTLDTIALR
ncbi:hypothetical protein DYB25_012547 [Aphanomyces astaci]|uniref:Uncharacterized protein n=1 Tax=Aphanomyces astaci TaxID=112090 RepID=A0A397C5T7_APHAT|nr:hypothetical protein DYB36_008454 [Aphanomyces astaci]RHY26220.1 hypothetical protein DYB25_012547 [Aphanomyces astaci]RHY39358.1 hypothetical protein DYB38_013675 [Aphanomyces astaci]RHY55187.1 hypothetical protein DYB34_014046 [Aphanomyces astaci]RHY76231.1 hypothetical protein DYB30_013307 [Aphanomyces astaci]